MKRTVTFCLVFIVLFPFFFLAMLSFGQHWMYPDILPAKWTVENWQVLLSRGNELSASLGLSILLSVGLAVFVTFLSFFTSGALVRSPRLRPFLVVAYFPYVFAPVILAATLQFFFIWSGLAGSVPGVMIGQLFILYPFGLIFFAGFWNQELQAMGDLAATMGSSPGQTLRKVYFPLAKGALLTGFFQIFLISWFEYGLTTLIGVGKVQTLTVKVFEFVNEANIFFAALSGVLLFIPPLVLLWLNKRFVFSEKP